MIDTLNVTPVDVPARLEDADAADFIDMATVLTRALVHDLGSDHLDWVPSEMLPGWLDQSDHLQGGFVARRGDACVGAVTFSGPREAGARELEFDLLASADARGAGVEEALLEHLISTARDLGRDVLQTYSIHPITEGLRQLCPPTGFGTIPLDHQSRFLEDNGFVLQQVDRNSVFDLTGDLSGIHARLAAAERFAGTDYRTVVWTSPTPPEYAEGFAFALSRMATDVPMSGLTFTEEVWDAERVRRRDARLGASGRLVSVAAVVHVPSDRVVAYNELTVGADRSRPSHQWGTLVVREHRGRRLGTIVKCANILRWRGLVPASPFISTFNAEENRPMLDVNEAIGFQPVAYGGAWRRDLA